MKGGGNTAWFGLFRGMKLRVNAQLGGQLWTFLHVMLKAAKAATFSHVMLKAALRCGDETERS